MIPKYRLILTYDIQIGREVEYSQFILNQFIPGIQTLDLYVIGVYHTLHGDYPSRQSEFAASSKEIMLKALRSDKFEELETALKKYIFNYNRKVVKYRKGFQF